MSAKSSAKTVSARDPSKALDLVLYKSDGCPYCHFVIQEAKNLGIPLKMRDTRRDAGAREELMRVGGRTMVPCLFIDGKPMYESRDIIRYLQNEVVVV